MEIIVEGRGQKEYKPEQIELTFNFETKDKSYETTLEKGIENVEEYIETLKTLSFCREDLKTCSFRMSENRRFDEKTRRYNTEGYIYNQNATLKFDYDMKRLAKLIDATAKSKSAPKFTINFTVKENEKVKEEILALAFENARFQAQAIAKASGSEIKECSKVSFQPFDGGTYSRSKYESDVLCKSTCDPATKTIANVLLPEDITVSISIFCQFITK